MMHVAICEDDKIYRNSIEDKIQKWSDKSGHHDVKVYCFSSSEDLFESWFKGFEIHIFFLDIEIPNEMNGLMLAQKIRSFNADVPIVFVTNYGEYVYQGYTFSALRYLKKPIVEKDIFPCLDIAYRRYLLLHQECSVLSIPGEHLVLRYAEILYIEAHSPNIEIFVLDSKNPFKIRYRLANILKVLPAEVFCPCHRSYIVNISQIRILKRTQLYLSSGEWLPVSEKYEDLLFERFTQYHQKGSVLK